MDSNPFFEKTEKKEENILLEILQSVIIAVAISVFLYVFILIPNEVDGTSMQPNFATGDLLFTSKLHKWFNGTEIGESLALNYNRGDVVVFQKPGREDYVKRIIGLPGEKIRIQNGLIYINDQPIQENFELLNSERKDGDFLKNGGNSILIPEKNYFVMGDNRDSSSDSRSFGFVLEDEIKGRVMFRFWPLDKFGIIYTAEFK